MMDEILLITLILAGIWYWWDTQQSNEIALTVCRQKCTNASLQLLDATIVRQRTWLRRGSGGSVQICRLYAFEYTNEYAEDSDSGYYSYSYSSLGVIRKLTIVPISIPNWKKSESL